MGFTCRNYILCLEGWQGCVGVCVCVCVCVCVRACTQGRETEGERTRPCIQQTRVSRGMKSPKDHSSSIAAHPYPQKRHTLKWAVDWLLLGFISRKRVKRRLQQWHASYLPKFSEINPEGEHDQLLLHTLNQLLKDTYRTAHDLRDPRKQMRFDFFLYEVFLNLRFAKVH